MITVNTTKQEAFSCLSLFQHFKFHFLCVCLINLFIFQICSQKQRCTVSFPTTPSPPCSLRPPCVLQSCPGRLQTSAAPRPITSACVIPPVTRSRLLMLPCSLRPPGRSSVLGACLGPLALQALLFPTRVCQTFLCILRSGEVALTQCVS